MSNIPALAGVPDVSFIDSMSLQETVEQTRELYINAYREITGTEPALRDADPVTLVLKTISMLVYQNMQYIDTKGHRELLKTATGDDLDQLAALLGLARKPAERATVTVRFTLSAAQPGVTAIPAGTRVRTEGGVYFNTVDYAEIPAGELYADVTAQAEEAGTAGNDIVPGSIQTIVDPIPYVAQVENTTTSSGGTDTESDDDFTERIYLAPSIYSCAGPRDAYEYYAKTWRNDVADVMVTNPSDCVVAIYFMLDGGKIPSEEEQRAMEAYLQGETIRPMCDKVECHAPEEVEYNIGLTYYIPRSESRNAAAIQAAVTQAVEDFKTWQRTLGRDINPTELTARLRNAGAKRVALTAPADAVVAENAIAKLGTESVLYGGLEDD